MDTFEPPYRFQNANGETLGRYAIAMRSIKEGAEVVRTEDGVVIDGDLYRHVRAEGVTVESEEDDGR